MGRALPVLALAGGVLLTATGVFLIALYIWSAVIVPWGQPDQSRLFWYLVFPLLGVMFLNVGVPLLVYGWKSKRNRC